MREALSTPARQIAINAGEDGSIIVGKILEKDQYSFGFDAQTGEYGNLVTKGIIDPTKVRACGDAERSFRGGAPDHHRSHGSRAAEEAPAAGAAMPPGGGMGGMDF